MSNSGTEMSPFRSTPGPAPGGWRPHAVASTMPWGQGQLCPVHCPWTLTHCRPTCPDSGTPEAGATQTHTREQLPGPQSPHSVPSSEGCSFQDAGHTEGPATSGLGRERPHRRDPGKCCRRGPSCPKHSKPSSSRTTGQTGVGAPLGCAHTPEVTSGQDLADQSWPPPGRERRHGALPRRKSAPGHVHPGKNQVTSLGQAGADTVPGEPLPLGTPRVAQRWGWGQWPGGLQGCGDPQDTYPSSSLAFPPRVFSPTHRGSVQSTHSQVTGTLTGTHPLIPGGHLVGDGFPESTPHSHPQMPLSHKMAESWAQSSWDGRERL